MIERNNPITLWDYCVERCASVHNITSINAFKLQGFILHATITEEQSDISNLFQFSWIEWVYYRDEKKNFPDHKERQGKALDPRKGTCNGMCKLMLQPSEGVIEISTASPLTFTELNSKVEEGGNIFLRIMHKTIGTSQTPG